MVTAGAAGASGLRRQYAFEDDMLGAPGETAAGADQRLELALADAAIADIVGTGTIESLFEATLASGRSIGFTYTSIAQHVHLASGIARPTIVNNYPERWRTLFKAQSYRAIDPVLSACQRHGGAMRWTDIETIIPLTQQQREVLNQARAHGLRSGCTFANIMPGLPTISCHFVMADNQPISDRAFMLAQVIGHAVCVRARGLWQAMPGRDDTGEGPELLSPRQVECVKLVARGKTSWEIATLLGISDQTVTEYLNDARRRMGVATRAQLVLHALHRGYFALDDVLE